MFYIYNGDNIVMHDSNLKNIFTRLCYYINLSLGLSNDGSALNMVLYKFKLDKESGTLYPTKLYLSGNRDIVNKVSNELVNKLDRIDIKEFNLSKEKGLLTILCNYCMQYGKVRPKVESHNEYEKFYDLELEKYWNKNFSLISSDFVLYANKVKNSSSYSYKMPKELYDYLMFDVLFRYYLRKRDCYNLMYLANALEASEFEGKTLSNSYILSDSDLNSDSKYILECIRNKDYLSIAKLMLPILKSETIEIPVGTKLYVGFSSSESSQF